MRLHGPSSNIQSSKPNFEFAALNYGVYRPQFLTNHCQMKNALTIAGMVLLATESFAQLTLDEAEKISAETGRTMFVVAGRKT